MTEAPRGRWWSKNDLPLFPLDVVERIGAQAFARAGLADWDASFAADALISKDLEGDYVRGVAKLPDMVRLLLDGTYDPRAELRVVRDAPAITVVETGSGFPRTMACRAMRLCMDKAQASGVGAVGLRGFCWSLAEHLRMAVEEGFVALILTQGPASMAPVGGVEPIISNSPIGIGVPAGKRPPMILDMSLTQTSLSPVWAAFLEDRPLPAGVALDETGRPTMDAGEVVTREGDPLRWGIRGSLLPIGGYKGYGLAVTTMILSSLLVGALPAWETASAEEPSAAAANGQTTRREVGQEIGHGPASPGTLFICLHVEQFTDLADFRAAVDAFLDRILTSKSAGATAILYPGLQSAQMRMEGRARNLVPLSLETRDAMNRMAATLALVDRLGEPVPESR
jgi:LDH2 family malate/lactate/ureidoglycolate dehydrogenase